MGIWTLEPPRMMRRLRYLHTIELRKLLIFRILISVMEEEVITPPRGGGASGP